MILFSTVLPAGKYVVGDPCYAFQGVWDHVLAAHRAQHDSTQFTYGGLQLVFCDAGGATDDEGFQYPVDSATFGIVPLGLVTADRDWLFKEETFARRDDRPVVRQRGAVLIESTQPVVVKLSVAGRYRTLFVDEKRFDLYEA